MYFFFFFFFTSYGDDPQIGEITLFPVGRFDLGRFYRGREEGYAAPEFSTSTFGSLSTGRRVGRTNSTRPVFSRRINRRPNLKLLTLRGLSIEMIRCSTPLVICHAGLDNWRDISWRYHEPLTQTPIYIYIYIYTRRKENT